MSHPSHCIQATAVRVVRSLFWRALARRWPLLRVSARGGDAPSDKQQHVPDDLTLFDLASTYGNPLFLSFFQKTSGISLENVAPRQNAFSIMMVSASALHWPSKGTSQKDINRKLDLKADFLQWMKQKNFGWHAGIVESHGVSFIQTLTIGVYWLLLGQRLVYRPNISYRLDLFRGWSCMVNAQLQKNKKKERKKRSRASTDFSRPSTSEPVIFFTSALVQFTRLYEIIIGLQASVPAESTSCDASPPILTAGSSLTLKVEERCQQVSR